MMFLNPPQTDILKLSSNPILLSNQSSNIKPSPCFLISANCHKSALSSSPFYSAKQSLTRVKTVIVAAGKRDSNNKKRKEDKHSFAAKPDESTGPFPEAVLLKERKVEEEGKLLPDFADDEERELFEALNLELESDLNLDRMRHYEVVYLIHEDHKEEVDDVNKKVQEFLKEKNGRIWRFSDWGMRKLAYKIQKARNAHYILMNFEVEAKWINEFKTMLDQDERVIRHLVMKRDKAETEDCPPPPEFHTLRADMDDDEAMDGDEDYDDEEDWDDEDDEGVIYVDDDMEEKEMVKNERELIK